MLLCIQSHWNMDPNKKVCTIRTSAEVLVLVLGIEKVRIVQNLNSNYKVQFFQNFKPPSPISSKAETHRFYRMR